MLRRFEKLINTRRRDAHFQTTLNPRELTKFYIAHVIFTSFNFKISY